MVVDMDMYVDVNVNEYDFWYRIAFHSSSSNTTSNVTEEKKSKPQKLDVNIWVVLQRN